MYRGTSRHGEPAFKTERMRVLNRPISTEGESKVKGGVPKMPGEEPEDYRHPSHSSLFVRVQCRPNRRTGGLRSES